MTKLSDYVASFIAEQGVKHVFLLSGGGCMHLLDSIGRSPHLDFICNLHEQAAAVAAEAYGQYTNNLGVALVTTGPGGTNTVTGVAAAWTDSTPVLFVSGQVKRADLMTGRGLRQMGPQEVDIVSIVRPITKYAATVTDPGSIRFHLEKACHLARSGRPGPVWLDIPLDVQAAQIEEDALPSFVADPGITASASEISTAVERAIATLNAAERPAILVGNGVRLARALDAFDAASAALDAPVLTTWKSIDFLADDDPRFAGRPGSVGQRGANFVQQNADWLLILGARIDLPQCGFSHEHFAPAARKIIVDIDAAEISKLAMPFEVALAADAGAFLRELLAQQKSIAVRERSAWWERCRAWRREYPVVLPEYFRQTGSVNNYVFVEVLSDALAENDLFVPGSSGQCSEISMQALRVKRGLRVFNSEGLGPMGFGIAAAVGGCLASSRRTVCVDGDGGFHMNCQELETVRRLGLPIKFFVLDNAGYVSIRTTQNNYFGGRLTASSPEGGLTIPDTRRVAEGYGIPTASIVDHEDLDGQIRAVLESPGPVVCVVRISPDQATVPKLSSRQLADGSFVSAALEDLFPFLDREELQRNMIAVSGD